MGFPQFDYRLSVRKNAEDRASIDAHTRNFVERYRLSALEAEQAEDAKSKNSEPQALTPHYKAV